MLGEKNLAVRHDDEAKPEPPGNAGMFAHQSYVPVIGAKGTCDSLHRMDAEAALSELLEVSPDVAAAIIARRSGEVLAGSVGGGRATDGTAATLGRRLADLLSRADRARADLGREPVAQLEIATGDGNVFMVVDADHFVAAITGSEPTVGLVFYELKTALRTIRGSANGKVAEETTV